MSLNKVMLIGNTGKEPVVRHLESGVVTASFSLATTERYKDRNGQLQENTEWHNVVCWRNLAEFIEKYVKKGMQLYVEGKLRNRSYTDKDGNTRYTTEVVADSIRLLERKSNSQATPSTEANNAPIQNTVSNTPSQPNNNITEEDSDDLPF